MIRTAISARFAAIMFLKKGCCSSEASETVSVTVASFSMVACIEVDALDAALENGAVKAPVLCWLQRARVARNAVDSLHMMFLYYSSVISVQCCILEVIEIQQRLSSTEG